MPRLSAMMGKISCRIEAMQLAHKCVSFACAAVICAPVCAFASGQCDATNLSASEVEKCLAGKEADKAKNQRRPVSFPSGLSGKTFDGNTQKYRTMTWISRDGKRLLYFTTAPCTLICTGGDILEKELPVERIISFTQGVAGEGSTAAQALVGTAIAAAIVPILAPFQAMTTTRNTMTFVYTVTYINDDGEEVTDNLLADSLVPVSDAFYTFLPTLTGLTHGEKKAPDVIASFYRAGAERLEAKVRADESLLVISDRRRPWCSKTQFAKFPLIASRYEATRKRLNEVRVRIGLAEYPAVTEGTEESLWQQHLKSIPNFGIWAKANPKAADKIKNCL